LSRGCRQRATLADFDTPLEKQVSMTQVASNSAQRESAQAHHSFQDPEHLQELYDTWLKMRDLLEQYAPLWYSDTVRERVEALAGRIKE
jgi:hypothetical protein